MQPEIRHYQPGDDLAALTELVHRAYAPHLKQGLRYWGTHQPSSDTEKRLTAGIGLVIFTHGQYVGTLTLRPPQPGSTVPLYRESHVYSLSQFCIAPEYKGHGLGRRLHDHALGIALKLGAKIVALDTAKPATSLIQLYESWGYAVVGECDWRPDTNYISVVMAREIATAGAA